MAGQIAPAPASSRLGNITSTIANGASLSDVADLKGYSLVGLQMPATWTAADLTFQASVDGTTYQDIYDDEGTEVTVVAVAAHYVRLDPALFCGFEKIKIRSGTGGTPVNQGGARAIVLAVREF